MSDQTPDVFDKLPPGVAAYVAFTGNAVRATASVSTIAAQYNIDEVAAVPIADVDRRVAELEAAFDNYVIDRADAPWLDTTRLATTDLPRPWADADWERDRRRWAVAQGRVEQLREPVRLPIDGAADSNGNQVFASSRPGLNIDPLPDLDRETWQVFAERGEDPVSEQLNAVREATIAQLGRYRANLVEAAQTAAGRQRGIEAAARERVEEENRLRHEAARAQVEMERSGMGRFTPGWTGR